MSVLGPQIVWIEDHGCILRMNGDPEGWRFLWGGEGNLRLGCSTGKFLSTVDPQGSGTVLVIVFKLFLFPLVRGSHRGHRGSGIFHFTETVVLAGARVLRDRNCTPPLPSERA